MTLNKFETNRMKTVDFIAKNAPTPGGHVFQEMEPFSKLSKISLGQNFLTKFHDHDWTINVASRVLTRFYYSYMPRPLGGQVFPPTRTIFELIEDIIGMNLLTKFHEDRKINVALRVLTRNKTIAKQYMSATGYTIARSFFICFTIFSSISGLFVAIETRILDTDVSTDTQSENHKSPPVKLVGDKNAPPPGSHVFQPTHIILKLVQDIIAMNLLTKFHEDRTVNVASRVENAPPLGSYVFQAHTNLLTKFHEDLTINEASRVLTRQMLTLHNRRRTKGDPIVTGGYNMFKKWG
ncbi:hypothetical protein DPMN_104676 [Dreissena polymorpha]|uniref:Uncharacterized protein n=1 Tax=Dreissena polymorpha TaxID=45954 RepID=A0A9D4K1V1_DREPO|nr:hypothetical protein DPMN_104676 [Dreissena polymorpha]